MRWYTTLTHACICVLNLAWQGSEAWGNKIATRGDAGALSGKNRCYSDCSCMYYSYKNSFIAYHRRDRHQIPPASIVWLSEIEATCLRTTSSSHVCTILSMLVPQKWIEGSRLTNACARERTLNMNGARWDFKRTGTSDLTLMESADLIKRLLIEAVRATAETVTLQSRIS